MSNETFSRKDLESWDKTTLMSECNARFGLRVNKNYNKVELIDLFIKKQGEYSGNSQITVDKNNEKEVPEGYVKIVVQPGKYNPKQRPIFCSLNFRPFTVPVNVPVIMPAEYESCLKDAVRRDYTWDEVEEELNTQDNFSYPYSIMERG